jgi:cytochrome P450
VTSTRENLDELIVVERELWRDGPPHDVFRRLRSECPVHWSPRLPEYPDEAGFWSVTRAQDIQAVSRDWRTYSSAFGVTATTDVFPLELIRAMFIGMGPPKHDRLKMLFQAGFTPRRIAAHEPAIRAIAVDVLDRLRGRPECDLVTDVAQPAVSRVIGSFMGIPPEDDAATRIRTGSTRAATRSTRPSGREAGTTAWVPRWRGSSSECCSRRRWRAIPTWSRRARRPWSSRRSSTS